MKPSEIAAWWGAIVATIVLFWDIYKWRQTAAKVRLSVSGNMEGYGQIAALLGPDQTCIVVEAANTGGRKTTITHLFADYYASIWRLIVRQPSRRLIVMPDGNLAQPLPFELDVGARWIGATYQSKELEAISQSGYLYVRLLHTASRSPVSQRLVISDPPAAGDAK